MSDSEKWGDGWGSEMREDDSWGCEAQEHEAEKYGDGCHTFSEHEAHCFCLLSDWG